MIPCILKKKQKKKKTKYITFIPMLKKKGKNYDIMRKYMRKREEENKECI
jgi:hypothetical protein